MHIKARQEGLPQSGAVKSMVFLNDLALFDNLSLQEDPQAKAETCCAASLIVNLTKKWLCKG